MCGEWAWGLGGLLGGSEHPDGQWWWPEDSCGTVREGQEDLGSAGNLGLGIAG